MTIPDQVAMSHHGSISTVSGLSVASTVPGMRLPRRRSSDGEKMVSLSLRCAKVDGFIVSNDQDVLAGRAGALRGCGPDVEAAFRRIAVDLRQFIRGERQVIECADAICHLLGAACADEGGGDASAA